MKKLSLVVFIAFVSCGLSFSQYNIKDINPDAKRFESLKVYNINNLNKSDFYLNLYHRCGTNIITKGLLDSDELKVFRLTQNSSRSDDIYLMDSLHMLEWGSAGREQWNLTKKNYFTYNNYGNETIWLIVIWDAVTSSWLNSNMFTSTYNEDGQMATKTLQIWQNRGWVNFTKLIYSYDENGNRTETISQLWDEQNSQWLNQLKDIFTYEDDLLVEWLQQVYTVGKRMWHNAAKTTYTYNNDDNVTMELQQIWVEVKGSWLNYLRIEYEYEAQNLIKETWENWSEMTSDWDAYWRHLYEYDGNNWLTNHTIQDLVPPVFVWENDYRWLFSYDNNGNIIEILEQYWDTEWINFVRTTDSFNTNEYLIQSIVEGWDEIDEQWEYWLKFLYFWSIHEIVGQNENQHFEYSVYPNPFSTFVNFELRLDQDGIVEIEIINLSGQVIEVIVADHKSAIINKVVWDATGNPPGLYFYKIHNHLGTKAGKLFLTD